MIHGYHKARFGEIEERGAALRPSGRGMYNNLLAKATDQAGEASCAADNTAVFERIFQAFPDDLERMRSEGLIYCVYQCCEKASHSIKPSGPRKIIDDVLIGRMVRDGVLHARTITYEDFLPFSAAGIFESNMHAKQEPAKVTSLVGGKPDKEEFQQALGVKVRDSDSLYRAAELKSIRQCAEQLGLDFNSKVFDG